MLPPSYSKLPAQFWVHVEVNKPSGCWVWTGMHTLKGYGAFYMRPSRTHRAHRWSAADKHGAIPKGLLVLHTCDVRDCVKPAHLYYGTAKDNAADAKKRGRWTHGEIQHSAKLTDAKVIRARELHSTGLYTYARLARENNVTSKTIRRAVTGVAWSHIQILGQRT